MKRLLFLISLITFTLGFCMAQEDEHAKVEKRIKEVQEYKMKFLAQEMELSEAQKKQFFELYEKMCEEKKDCYKESVDLNRKVKHDKDATEEDFQHATEAKNKANQEWAEIEKQYNEKFADFLSPKQIYTMHEAENTFRSKFEEMKHNRRKEHKGLPKK